MRRCLFFFVFPVAPSSQPARPCAYWRADSILWDMFDMAIKLSMERTEPLKFSARAPTCCVFLTPLNLYTTWMAEQREGEEQACVFRQVRKKYTTWDKLQRSERKPFFRHPGITNSLCRRGWRAELTPFAVKKTHTHTLFLVHQSTNQGARTNQPIRVIGAVWSVFCGSKSSCLTTTSSVFSGHVL